MFGTIISALFSSIGGGAITGIAGAAVQRYFDTKKLTITMQDEKDKRAHELEMKRVDIEMMDKELAANIKIADTQANATIEVADAQAFSNSFNAEPQRYSRDITVTPRQALLLILLDIYRAIVRPTLALVLVGVTISMWIDTRSLLDRSNFPISSSDALNIYLRITETLLYLTSTCVLWYFGTRNKQKPPQVRDLG